MISKMKITKVSMIMKGVSKMYIFGILKKDKIMASFIEKDYDSAKLYFLGYIFQDEKFNDYKLYKIGTIDSNLKINPMKVFITGGYETKYKQEFDTKKINQLKLDEEKAKQETEQIKQIEKLFNGRAL